MNKHPINLLLRFLLELAALIGMGVWGWTTQEGLWRPLLGLGIPLLAAALWGVFRVPGDPREAPVAVRGWVRLLLEGLYFAAGVGLLAAAGQQTAAGILGALVILHYLVSYDRIRWLLEQR